MLGDKCAECMVNFDAPPDFELERIPSADGGLYCVLCSTQDDMVNYANSGATPHRLDHMVIDLKFFAGLFGGKEHELPPFPSLDRFDKGCAYDHTARTLHHLYAK